MRCGEPVTAARTSKPTSLHCLLLQEAVPTPPAAWAQHLDSSSPSVPYSSLHEVTTSGPFAPLNISRTHSLSSWTVSDPGPGVLPTTPRPSHPTPCPPHGGMLLEPTFESLSRLNRARARLWSQVSPDVLMAREPPAPGPAPGLPGHAPGLPSHAPGLPGHAPRPRLLQSSSRSSCSSFRSAQTGPTARRVPGQTSHVSTCGWGGLRPSPSGHRPLHLTAAVTHCPLPKAQGRCLPASRGPARPSPVLREQDGETSRSEGRAGPDKLQRRREVPVTNPRPGARAPCGLRRLSSVRLTAGVSHV